MTSETYLDLTFDRGGKSSKRPIRPKLLKLTDVTMPHRSRKKTKVKAKDRSVSSVRDRIYDDPAYTDDISHLANPLRRNSCSGKPDGKAKNMIGGSAVAIVAAGGSSSLGKRSKLSKEFLQQNKLRNSSTAYERDVSSSSDEPLRSDSHSKSAAVSAERRGRSLERSAVHLEGRSVEKKREKREHNNKQKANICVDNAPQQQPDMQQKKIMCKDAGSASNRRKTAQPAMMIKQYSDGSAAELQWTAEQARDEMASVHSGTSTARAKALSAATPTTSSSGGSSKMQIGRRFLRGEIGIKSFNYYLLKEGIKSSKRFVEKQRNSFASGLAVAAGVGKKSHSRSEENIYEEIFFKDAPPSDEEEQQTQQQQQSGLVPKQQVELQQHQQQQPQLQQAQHLQQHQTLPQAIRGAGTPISQCSGSEEGIYADCEICLQQCNKENCEYCYVAQQTVAADGQGSGKVQRDMAKPYAIVSVQQQQQQQQQQQPQFESIGRPLITKAPSCSMHASADFNSVMGGNSNIASGKALAGDQLPTAHILEFQSYNPNNPGVFKIETTPVAITGEYNPILQFQQSSPSTGTATTTTPSAELQPRPQLDLGHHTAQHQQPLQQPQLVQQLSYQSTPPRQQQQQFKHLSQSYLTQGGVTLPHHHYHHSPGFSAVSSSSAGILITQQRVRGANHRGGAGNQHQASHYMVTYNAPAMSVGPPTAVADGMQRMNTKSSSSSDSLQHQHLHKYNTMSRLEAQQVLMGDPFYGGARVGPSNSLMFAASRPIGGSQILVDPYDVPQMHKSDSRASILSEYSLRSSDNSRRYNRFRYAGGSGGSFSGVAGGSGAGCGGQVSDSSLGDSLFSCTSTQRRYFGSSESCRFGFECRRCSLDGGEKCSYSDNCRYECRNCDCSSSYFSSDFDDMYGSVAGAGGSAAALAAQRSSGIPRKTAAGTLPTSAVNREYDRPQDQLDLKQNKYAQDFFKHVNDVKRSIYQSEMQRNGSSGESSRARGDRSAAETHNTDCSPLRHASKQSPQITTLPLTKERTRASRSANVIPSNTDSSAMPMPAPRTSLQQVAQSTTQPQPKQRGRHAQSHAPAYERHSEYPSLDRLVASATGAIPKTASTSPSNAGGKPKTNTTTLSHTAETDHDINSNNATRADRHSPRHSPKSLKITDRPLDQPSELVPSADMDAVKVSSHETRVATEAITSNNKKSLELTAADANQNDAAELSTGAKAGSFGGVGGSAKREARYLSVEQARNAPAMQSGKRHHRSTSASKQTSVPTTRRSKDIPAPPPPSPATYSDLQELKANLENAQQQGDGGDKGDTRKSSAERRKKKYARAESEGHTKIVTNECQLKTEKDDQQLTLALEPTKQMQTVGNLSPTRSVSGGDKNVTMKSPKSRAGKSVADDIQPHTGDATSTDLCEPPTALLAVAKSSVAAAVAIAGANCMPDANTVMQQETDTKKPRMQIQPERAHAKPSNTTDNNSSKNSWDSAKQLDICNSAHATDDDDVFYDARSEDSGGTAASVASSSLLRQQATTTLKGRSEQRSQLQDKNASSPEFSRGQHKEVEQKHQPHEQRIASGSEIKLDTQNAASVQSVPVNGEDNATAVQTKSKDTLVANSESVKIERTAKGTTTKSNDEATVARKTTQVAAEVVKNIAANGATGSLAMALNLVEATAATVATKTARASELHNVVGDGGGGAGSSSHSRREKKQRGTSSCSRESSKRQHKAATTPAMTISCDTCCQVECEQYQQPQQQPQQLQQQAQKSSRRHESRADSKTKTGKERANKIKDEKNKESGETTTTIVVYDTPAALECGEQATITPPKLKTKAKVVIKLGDSQACATAMLPDARATAANVCESLPSDAVAVATAATTTAAPITAADVKTVNTTTVLDQIGAQTNSISKSSKGINPQHVAEAVDHSAVTVEHTVNANLPSEQLEIAAKHVGREKVAAELSSRTTPTRATIIITPAEPTTNTTITTAGDTTVAAMASATVAAKLLKETATSTPTLASAATLTTIAAALSDATAAAAALATTSPATSAANSTASCISDIAGVTTPSYSSVKVPIITTTAQSSLDSDPTTQLKAVRDQVKRPPLQRQDYSTCVDSSEAQSDDSHLTRDSVTRESQNDELSSSTHDKIDVSTLPLPALPPKKRRTRLRASPSRHQSGSRRGCEHDLALVGGGDETRQTNTPTTVHLNLQTVATGSGSGCGSCGEATPHLSAFQQYVAKRRESLEASSRSFSEKLEARRMHYHMGGGGGCESGVGGSASGGPVAGGGTHKPTYLFGEQYYGMPTKVTATRKSPHGNKEEIFLNKSGWVQVNTKRNSDESRGGASGGYRSASYAHQNGRSIDGERDRDLRRTVRVIQIDNTRRSDRARQALQQQHHYSLDPAFGMGKYPPSKVEELIQRNKARIGKAGGPVFVTTRDNALRPGYRIVDPQLASILNERPGFLPVRNLHDADSPPPITPILSPPPAFQDSSKSKYVDRRKTIPTRQHQLALTTNNLHAASSNGSACKGMVFSRSFEYDTRRKAPADNYVETFSRSFDGNLSERPRLQRERSPNFSSLTGNSPNYLTKKDSGGGSSGSLRSRDNSPKCQHPQTTAYLNASVKEAPPAYSLATVNPNSGASSRYSPRARHERSFERSKSHNVLVRSRKSQFNRGASGGAIVGAGVGSQQPMISVGMSRFRSFDTTASQRLNSCDSGARSDLSNDELDCDDDEGSNEFLTANYHHSISPLKTQRQRSLTPDRNESLSSSSSIRKQRSLTPESRSLTPEDRRRKGGSQASLMGSRQNSSSRSNTLERKQRLTEGQSTANISRSSSSSSYSGGGEHDGGGASIGGLPATTAIGVGAGGGGGSGGVTVLSSGAGRTQHRRSLGRNAKQVDEHRIRRSRSLQLSERSPNRAHKVIASMGQSQGAATSYHTANAQPIYQQAGVRVSNSGAAQARPHIRTSNKSQSLLLSTNNASSGRARNNDIDKSRSFDFDYCNYNNQVALKGHAHVSGSGSAGSGSGSGNNQNVPLRLDFDKSRSFDDDYRQPLNSISNNLTAANGMRYLQAIADGCGSGSGSGSNKASRLQRSSPVGSAERNSRSPQSSGSSCNNLNLPRQSTSPQNYGTRLCDHELTYDMLRKSLDRSPIMDFRRGDSGEYDLPPALLRNRETINSGGNSELNFFNNDTTHIYEQPATSTATGGSSLKQQRSLGHTHSPSESQYSLERQHSANASRRESMTPESASGEYRGERLYRHPHTRESSREGAPRGSGSSSNSKKFTTPKAPVTAAQIATTATTINPNKITLKRQEALLKSPTTCSFWPNCGACAANAVTRPEAATSKRQVSLRDTQQLPLHSQHTTKGEMSVRRNSSSRAVNGIIDSPSIVKSANDGAHHNSYSPHKPNVSTISVNSNFNAAPIEVNRRRGSGTSQNNFTTMSGVTRKKTQWTLLCSGAALMDSNEESRRTATKITATSTAATTATKKSDTLADTAAPRIVVRSSTLPSPSTASIFLGICEMPITRERELCKKYDRERVYDRERKRGLDSTRKPMQREVSSLDDNRTITERQSNDMFAVRESNNECDSMCAKQPAAGEINSGSMIPESNETSSYAPTATVKVIETATITATSTSAFVKHTNPLPTTTSTNAAATCGMPHMRVCDWRSISLPNILLSSTGSSRATNFPAQPVVNDAKSSYSTNLTQQMRAVSSPSLTDALQEEENDASATNVAQTTFKEFNSTSGSGEPALTMFTATTTNSSRSNNSSRRSVGLPNSQSVGVLQKFKRTLTHFNKPTQQAQQQQQQVTNSSNTQTLNNAATASSTTATNVCGGSIGGNNSITAENQPETTTSSIGLEGAAGKYRFGPLIWRSSKERRKTKYNRRDKCNSGDSGIQIELDNDEQFSRILVAASCGGDSSAGAAASTQRGANERVTLKMRSVRRTNSAKATSITDQSATATLNAKAKILKRMEIYGGSMEREAPESLPARSLSQPNGLDMCGIGRTAGDLDESDSDSVTSHEEAPNYYPIYAEVLYSFTAAGPQELGLERGTLIEILRKEVGPWWFGRIRKEENNTLVEEILDPELGWFPKEFVRVIQCPKADVFFLSQMANAATSAQQTPPITKQRESFKKIAATSQPKPHSTTATPSTATTMNASNEASTLACDLDATIVDENNVTTIVIESPSYVSLPNAPYNSSSSSDAGGGGGGSGVGDASNALAPSRSINVILDSADILRRSAVKELLDTEINYVKLLSAICEGYLPAMSKRIDVFSPNSIRLIFSNITAIYKFQRKFLEALRKGIEQNQIAKVFLKMHKGFLCYSTYCNAYPRALIELETYDRIKDAKTILDNCRESENLAELPLSAHLLAPVQRICRYPLHLSEILKGAAKCGVAPEYELPQYEQFDVSQMDIPDTHEKIDLALEAMRGITEAVNEGKRHSETIARHQASFQNFKGPPLHLHSTRFFLQIDATRQKQNLWNSSCTLFLFDNQLIYCKRDIIKRSHFIYKGRIFLDRCRVVNVRDGKMFGHNIRNSLRIYCEARDKLFDFSFRSANRKHRFLSTLALERQFGGKAFYVSEMTGFEYAYDERDYSDQSDYELPDCEHSNSSGGAGVGAAAGVGGGLVGATRHWSMADVSTPIVGGAAATSGDSSVPESPVKYKYSDTLPKKSQARDAGVSSVPVSECQTGSLGRRRLGNWFRKPKSSNSTPNHSPTHKAHELSAILVGGSENNISINVGGGNYISSGSSA